jgi:hypothetical protein
LPPETPLPKTFFKADSNKLIAPSAPADLRPIVISGPSGVGKGTLYKMLLEKYPSTFATSISHTTRDPRPGEKRDVDYYYVPMQEFEDLIEEKGFVEHAKFGGNRYGTSKKMIREMGESGRIVVLDIEMEVRFSPPCDGAYLLLLNLNQLWRGSGEIHLQSFEVSKC